MDAVLVVLSVVSIVASIILAWVIYQVLRVLICFFKGVASEDDKKRSMLLRLPDRTVAILCAVCFVALVL